MVSAAQDKTTKIWSLQDLNNITCKSELTGFLGRPHSVAVTNDSKLLAVSESDTGHVYLWNLTTAKLISKWEATPKGVYLNCVQFS
jgi:WD40 repeat protein